MDNYIYINYAYEDQDQVMPLIRSLKEEGIKLFYGNGNEEKVRGSSLILNLVTAGSDGSRAFRKILNYALKHKREMLSVNLSDGKNNIPADENLDLALGLYKYKWRGAGKAKASQADEAAAETAKGLKAQKLNAEDQNAETLGERSQSAETLGERSQSAESIKAENLRPDDQNPEPLTVRGGEGPVEMADGEAQAEREGKVKTIVTRQPEVPIPAGMDRQQLYEEGMKVFGEDPGPERLAYAFACIRQAANQGLADAQYQLSVCYAQGIAVPVDLSEAARNCEMAAYGGHIKAQGEIGYCYENGYGVTRNINEAIRWYEVAAENGNYDACNNLAYCYQKGRGVRKDLNKAITLYEVAAASGHASAMFNLGYLYWFGEGCAMDKDKAVECFMKASERGNARAKEMVRELRLHGYIENRAVTPAEEEDAAALSEEIDTEE